MSAAMVQAVLASDLKPAGLRLVALAMAWHADDKTALAWPGRATLARETALSVDQVARYLVKLEQVGVLEVVTRGGSADGRKWVSRYRFHSDGLGASMPPVGHDGLGASARQDWGHGCGKPGAPMPPRKDEREIATQSLRSSKSATRSSRTVAPRGRSVRAAGRAALAASGFDAHDRVYDPTEL